MVELSLSSQSSSSGDYLRCAKGDQLNEMLGGKHELLSNPSDMMKITEIPNLTNELEFLTADQVKNFDNLYNL